jgi:hypothetical protein
VKIGYFNCIKYFLWLNMFLISCKSNVVLPVLHSMQLHCERTEECGSKGVCVDGLCVGEQALCSPLNISGVCAAGKVCRKGACAEISSGWCDCKDGQGCMQGRCVDTDISSLCMPGQEWGVCAGGEVCVGGFCVPFETGNMCSLRNPEGWCAAGASCVSGVCSAVSYHACSAVYPEGVCAPGHACVAGVCQIQVCSVQAPLGVCGAHETCREGVCEAVACSATHPSGVCNASGTYCSNAGVCIVDGMCAHDADCRGDEWCGAQGACLPRGTCRTAQDCHSSTRMACVAGVCEEDTSCDAQNLCAQGEWCSPAHRCVPEGRCVSSEDCTDGKYCSAEKQCLAQGTCGVDEDCAEGQSCTQGVCEVPSSLRCNSNVFVTSGCPSGASRCCEAGRTCCGSGQKCSALGGCVNVGRCTGDADCLEGFFSCQSHQCVPLRTCQNNLQCGVLEKCSYTGACVPKNACITHADCGSGYTCGPLWTCQTAQSCGVTQFSTTLVQPNVLIVLDRSASMNLCDGDGATRWSEANSALESLLNAYGDRIRFGLSTFPARCGTGGACTRTCGDWYCNSTCGGAVNCLPGGVDEPVGDNNATRIMGSVAANHPGGYTPTGFTMEKIAQQYTQYGLEPSTAAIKRAQFVLLVTDGEVNCFQGGTNDSPLRVNNALRALSELPSSIRTFVVGFAFGGRVSGALNCHAVYGKTQKCSASVNTSNCANTREQCYYNANNPLELVQAFRSIAGQVASCTYTLERVPLDVQKLYVQLEDRNGVRTGYLPRQGADGWYLSADGLTLTFSGESCSAIKERGSSPVVVYGCPDVGG